MMAQQLNEDLEYVADYYFNMGDFDDDLFREDGQVRDVEEKLVATFFRQVGQKFLSTYQSYGTYVAYLTILLMLYLVSPNYISFVYLYFLLFWIIGRQLVEKTRRCLWFPLKLYAVLVFVFTYCLRILSSFQMFISKLVNLYPDLGFNPDISLLENIWESLAVLIVMQLYYYEMRQDKYERTIDASDAS